jgi:RepB DNA-primase from phage plasmid
MTAAQEFLEVLSANLPEEERIILCGFGGDPANADHSAWKPLPYRPGRDLKFDIGLGDNWNAYATVSSFGRVADNTFRRRSEAFAAGRALLIDDVHTKVAFEKVAGVPPSAKVLTSYGNEQWWYFLSTPERDVARFDGIIRAFISQKLCDQDPGMAGVARVGRIPGYINGKKAYGGAFRTQLLELNDKRFTIDELLAAFDLKINGARFHREKLTSDEAVERNRMFMVAYKFLAQRNMLKQKEPDLSGWIQCTCPWVHEHTGGVDNGSAIREPSPENNFFGAFRCHHRCIDRGWGDLTDWINEMSIEELEEANKHDH